MAVNEIIKKIEMLKELQRMAEELDAEIEATKDAIKAEMNGEDEMIAGPFKVTNKLVTSSRIDSAGLKKVLSEEMIAKYTKVTSFRRFCVN